MRLAYWLDAGSAPGGNNYFQSGNLGNVLTVNVTGLPTDGSTVYVTLYSLIGGQWVSNAYTYTAFNLTNGLAVMQTPANLLGDRRQPGGVYLECGQ